MPVVTGTGPAVRAPASSANLGAGFDVLGMALDLPVDVGVGEAPEGARPADDRHPARRAFERLGGSGPVWWRTRIPMARGLGSSAAMRVGGAALAVVAGGGRIEGEAQAVLDVAAELEGHGDNAAAALHGGVTAYVAGAARRVPLGPVLAAAAVVAWVPDVTTSTDRSRRALPERVDRSAAVANIGRASQLVLAVATDDPSLLVGATDDALHQAERLPAVEGAAEAIERGVAAGAWCGWLSGSGPTVALLAARDVVDEVVAALPPGGHPRVLSIDPLGARALP